MTAGQFRRDRCLRSSGYNLIVWGAVHGLLVLPWWPPGVAIGWSERLTVAYGLAVVAAGALLTFLNDNRVGKMWGPAAEPLVRAGRLWSLVLLFGAMALGFLLMRGALAMVPPVWMIVVASGFLLWGSFTLREFLWLGGTLLVPAVVMAFASPVLSGSAGCATWLFFMSGLWIALGIRINREYLYVRPPPSGDERRARGRSGDSGGPSSRSSGFPGT